MSCKTVNGLNFACGIREFNVSFPPMRCSILERPDGDFIAYLKRTANRTGPGILWLSGFKSDMTGTKATALDDWAARTGRGYTRFDYFGHGASSGAFRDGTITRWRDDALAVIDRLTDGPQILVGSSMGAWIALLATLARPDRIAGMVLIAPAPDFTEELIWADLSADAKHDIESNGEWMRPSAYGLGPYPITRALIEDGRKHLVLRDEIPIHCPVILVQGMQDPEVPFETSIKLARRLAASDVSVTLVKNGDHRMSDAPSLEHVFATLERVLSKVG